MIESLETLSWLISAIAIPFAVYVFNQISASKDDRQHLKDMLNEHKIYSEKKFVKIENLNVLLKELKKDFKDLKSEIKNDIRDALKNNSNAK